MYSVYRVYYDEQSAKLKVWVYRTGRLECVFFFFVCFFNCVFYQLLHVQHRCSSTQSWGSVLPSIVETRDQSSRGCPLLFSNRNLGSFCA